VSCTANTKRTFEGLQARPRPRVGGTPAGLQTEQRPDPGTYGHWRVSRHCDPTAVKLKYTREIALNSSAQTDREPLAHGGNHPPKLAKGSVLGYPSSETDPTAAQRVPRAKITVSFRLAGELFLRPLHNSPEKVPFEGQEFWTFFPHDRARRRESRSGEPAGSGAVAGPLRRATSPGRGLDGPAAPRP
jgi:hypothetical protein